MPIRTDFRSREALKAEAARSWLLLHPLLRKVRARLEAGAYNAPDFSEEPSRAASSKGGAAFAFPGMPLARLGLALDGDASWS